ncbi:PASTA domain-containing protein [Calidithermus chliarophilus]|uniref:PASTA domain-containing protein n=1 Tax=Calidithermus chliarophilus TaxID=52023 RepID=UPI000409A365|nr:PASTA domain-containing protein [Calidithermus chliarophilus]
MPTLADKYEVLEELWQEGFIKAFRVALEGRHGKLYWFDVHTPEARAVFAGYRNALRRLEERQALPEGLEISNKPGRYYAFWPESGRHPLRKARLKPVQEALEPFGYTPNDFELVEHEGRPVVVDLRPRNVLSTPSIPAHPGRPGQPQPPTRPIPSPKTQPIKPAPAPAPKARPQPRVRPPLPKPGLWGWLPGLVFLLLGLGSLAVAVQRYLNPPEYTLPNFSGKTATEVLETVRTWGLKLEFGEGSDLTRPEDTVLEQTPEPGSQVKPGRKLTLTINKHKRGTVPTLSGRSVEDARKALLEAGYTLGGVVRINSPTLEGTVLASRPPAGTSFSAGKPVELLVSAGPGQRRPETVLPDLVGLSQEDAKYLLDVAELRGNFRSVVSGAPQGEVVRQEPAAGTPLLKGTAVTVYVSNQLEAPVPDGPPFAQDVPEPLPEPAPEPPVPGGEGGTPQPAARSLQLSLTLPPELEGSNVRITIQDEARPEPVVIFEGPTAPGWKFEPPGGVPVQGRATVRWFVNDQLYQEFTDSP